MKTTGRENQKPWARAFAAEVQNRSCLNKWAAKQEKFQPLHWCFFLTAPFIELTRHEELLPSCPSLDRFCQSNENCCIALDAVESGQVHCPNAAPQDSCIVTFDDLPFAYQAHRRFSVLMATSVIANCRCDDLHQIAEHLEGE